MFEVNGAVYCEPCGDVIFKQLKEEKTLAQAFRKVDLTICVKCGTDSGTGPFNTISEAPFCPICTEGLYQRKFPIWLVWGLSGILALLCFALIHSKSYFRAARSLYRGERLANAGRFSEAIPHLAVATKIAPQCDASTLLYAKAAFLTGDPRSAFQALEAHDHGKFNDQSAPYFQEVSALAKRIDPALGLIESSQKKFKMKDGVGAIQDLDSAKKIYPEITPWLEALRQGMQVSEAFDHKDYDKFLKLCREDAEREPNDSIAVAGLASALAAKFAETGGEDFKVRAEAALERAKTLAVTQEQQNNFKEYSERIRYRLDSRRIIDKEEFDRLFRKGKVVKS